MIAQAKEFLGKDWTLYEQLFAQTLDSRIPILNKVNQYLMERSGKQLRPILCLLAAHLCSGCCSEASVSCAVASEQIHTATLLHDEVADEADTRRGMPTVSALLSPRAAVLVGDFWLSRAVEAIVSNCQKETFSDFARCLGDLAEGEMFQIEKAADLDTGYDDYIYIIAHKTASLFRAAMKGGARNSGATQAQIEAVDTFAYHLGLAFQMRDDILDYSPQLSLGKPTGVDIAERKITLPLLGALANAEASKAAADGCAPGAADARVPGVAGGLGEAASSVRASVVADIEAGRFDAVMDFVRDNGGIEYAQKILEAETRSAIEALEAFGPCPARELLSALAGSLCLREK